MDENPTQSDHANHGESDPGGALPRPARRWPRRLRRIAIVAAVLVTTATVGAAATVYVLGSRLADNVRRVEGAFDGLAPTRDPVPNPATPESRTILAVGSDLRADGQSTGSDAEVTASVTEQRTDTIMLIRIDPVRDSATVVSIPRDSWVPIPGHGRQKINAAYPLGGPPLLIKTVERLTDIRVDHFMIIDFVGFESIVDALGGVRVQVAQAVTGPGNVHFRTGANDLNGAQALSYVRQRQGLPRGDLDRVRRQQNLLRAILIKISATKPSGDPRRTYRLLDAVTRSVTVDDGVTDADLRTFALEAARLRQENVWFLTAAVRGGGWEGGQSVLYLDEARNAPLWTALGADTMAEYVANDQSALLVKVPR
nr:LCP family protein [Micromonospora sp. DSM 115978]